MSMTRLALTCSVLCALVSPAAAQVPPAAPVAPASPVSPAAPVPPQPFLPLVVPSPFGLPMLPPFDPSLPGPLVADPQRGVTVVPVVPAPPKGPLSVVVAPRAGSDETALYEQARALIDQN